MDIHHTLSQIDMKTENKIEYTLKELIAQDNIFKTKEYIHTYPQLNIGPSKKFILNISPQYEKNEYKSLHMVSNPVIIFDLDEGSELEFDTANVFNNITLQIGGSQYDRLYDKQIEIYNRIFGLDVEKKNSKIFYPIPFEIMNCGQGIFASECMIYEIHIVVDFCSNPQLNMIQNISIKTELTICADKINSYMKINDYNSQMFINDYGFYHQFYSDKNIEFKNQEQVQVQVQVQEQVQVKTKELSVRIKQNQFYALETLQQGLDCVRIKTYFNHLVERFFIYFQNPYDNSIYWNTQQFETIRFIANGYTIAEYDYESIVSMNNENILGYKLPRGVFEIKWDIEHPYKHLSKIDIFSIELFGLTIPKNTNFGICAQSINYIRYMGNMCGVCFSC